MIDALLILAIAVIWGGTGFLLGYVVFSKSPD